MSQTLHGQDFIMIFSTRRHHDLGRGTTQCAGHLVVDRAGDRASAHCYSCPSSRFERNCRSARHDLCDEVCHVFNRSPPSRASNGPELANLRSAVRSAPVRPKMRGDDFGPPRGYCISTCDSGLCVTEECGSSLGIIILFTRTSEAS